MMATRTVEWKGGEALKRKMAELNKKLGTAGAVQVGFFEDERYTPRHPIRGTKRKPLHVAQVAFWNIYGTKRTPARDFMGAAIRGHQGNYGKDLADIGEAVGWETRRALQLLGELMKEDVQHSIQVWSQPANAKRTQQIKGFNKPLIDDGTMQRAVGVKVVGV